MHVEPTMSASIDQNAKMNHIINVLKKKLRKIIIFFVYVFTYIKIKIKIIILIKIFTLLKKLKKK